MRILLLCLSCFAFAQVSVAESITSCYAYLQNDTLRIGNKSIEHTFLWNHGNIITIELTDKKVGFVGKVITNHLYYHVHTTRYCKYYWKSNTKSSDITFPL